MSETNQQPNQERTRATRERPSRDSATGKWLSGVASLFGLWVVISSFVFQTTQAGYWNDIVVGAGIFLIAGYNYYRITSGHLTSVGAMSLVTLLGLWTLVAPFIFAVGSQTLLWSNVISGAVTAILAAYVAYEGSGVRSGAPAGAQ